MTREQIIAALRQVAQSMENNPYLDYSQKISELSQAAYEAQQRRRESNDLRIL